MNQLHNPPDPEEIIKVSDAVFFKLTHFLSHQNELQLAEEMHVQRPLMSEAEADQILDDEDLPSDNVRGHGEPYPLVAFHGVGPDEDPFKRAVDRTLFEQLANVALEHGVFRGRDATAHTDIMSIDTTPDYDEWTSRSNIAEFSFPLNDLTLGTVERETRWYGPVRHAHVDVDYTFKLEAGKLIAPGKDDPELEEDF